MQIPLYKLLVLWYKKKHKCVLGKCSGINLFIDKFQVNFLDFPSLPLSVQSDAQTLG